MQETLAAWDKIKSGEFDIIISDVTINELDNCREPKRTKLFDFLSEIKAINAKETKEVVSLTNKYLEFGVLNEKSRDDCRHIALATINECDYIISWNFKHLVNINTIKKVPAINKLLGYDEIEIISPSMFLGGD